MLKPISVWARSSAKVIGSAAASEDVPSDRAAANGRIERRRFTKWCSFRAGSAGSRNGGRGGATGRGKRAWYRLVPVLSRADRREMTRAGRAVSARADSLPPLDPRGLRVGLGARLWRGRG